jgi:argininosuccinate lyase
MKKQGKKLWGGIFSKPTHPLVEAFTDSTRYENRLVPYDIQGSLAHAAMLGKVGILKRSDSAKLQAGLKRILKEWQAGRFKLKPEFEDVHGNVEARLSQILGSLAGKLHSGRSRNDQVALDERLYLKDAVTQLRARLKELQSSFIVMAELHRGVAMPGYTHLQRAQPILFAHWCMAYVEMFARDQRRMEWVLEELDECPLGASALAGSSLPLDRHFVAKALGFSKPTENSLDSVSNRDYLVDFASALALLMAHFSRLGEEIVLFTSQEFGFFKLDEAFATGSSLMPQKKNPDVAELLRGRAGRAYGLLVHLLTLIKGQPLAYNRDMQEDKEALFQVVDMVAQCAAVTGPLLHAITPDAVKMLAACKTGYLEATDAADYLVRKGVPFRQAHEVIGKIVKHCQARQMGLADLALADWKGFHALFEADLFKAIDLGQVLSARNTYGGTAPAQLAAAIRRAKARLSGRRA